MITKLYSYLKKDPRAFFEGIVDESIFWYIKQWSLLGVSNIPYKEICSKYFKIYNYFRIFKVITEEINVNFAWYHYRCKR